MSPLAPADAALTAGDRAEFARCLAPELSRLRRFIQQQLAFAERAQDIGTNEIDPDDVLDTAVLEALTDATHRPATCPAKHWLYQKALQVLNSRVQEVRERRGREVSLSTDVTDAPDAAVDEDLGSEAQSFWVLGEDLQLGDLIANLTESARTPEDKAVEAEMHQSLLTGLQHLPATQREAFLLHNLEGEDTALIARAQGRPEDDVTKDIEAARASLFARFKKEGYVNQ